MKGYLRLIGRENIWHIFKMTRSCCVRTCSTVRRNRVKGDSNSHFFKLPSNSLQRKSWNAALSPHVSGDAASLSVHTYVCAAHFTPECFNVHSSGRLTLRSTAVPSLFHSKSGISNLSAKQSRCTPLKRVEDLQRDVQQLQENLTLLQKVGHNAFQELKHANAQVTQQKMRLEELISELYRARLVTQEQAKQLEAFRGLPVEMFRKGENNAWSPEMRQFALTLHLYGSKAYDYVRSVIPLPSARTLRSWLQPIKTSAGFLDEAFSALRARADDPNYRVCGIMLDGMHIRKHLDYDRHADLLYGYCDLGDPMDSGNEKMASEAMVFMAVGLKTKWKLPLAYFFVTDLSSAKLASLLSTTLDRLHCIGVRAISVTLDGSAVNMKAIRLLGCKWDSTSFSFPHPSSSGLNVFVYPDPCHMLKLLRNLWAAWRVLYTVHGPVRWAHLEKLNNFQSKEGLVAANKLSERHIHFERQKMNVSLAAQTMSHSTAIALKTLWKLCTPDFEDTKPTEVFLKLVDELFDRENCQSASSLGTKAPLTIDRLSELRDSLTKCKELLLPMCTVHGNLVVDTKRHVGVNGFLCAGQSLLKIGEELLTEWGFSYFLSIRLSQDSLELFFNGIRRAGGWNNNPTVMQFCYTIRRFLAHATVILSPHGNVKNMENTRKPVCEVGLPGKSSRETSASDENSVVPVTTSSISKGSSVCRKRGLSVRCENVLPILPCSEPKRQRVDLDDDEDKCPLPCRPQKPIPPLSAFAEKVVAYVGGFVLRKLPDAIKCGPCKDAIFRIDASDDSLYSLIRSRDFGGLFFPSKDIVYICCACESVMQQCENPIRAKISQLQELAYMHLHSRLFSSQQKHFALNAGHFSSILEIVSHRYFVLRKFHAIRLSNDKQSSTRTRFLATKNIIFRGE